jgi:2-aminophenol/2-amino-5-chlorophenol 1,6-dioxygenase alpha subunit
MTVVSAFLVHGSPLPYLRPDNLPWSRLSAGYRTAGRALAASRPDTIILYSTQWITVLDELWQTRAELSGTHVDENWYEYGDLEYSIKIDQVLAEACIEASRGAGIKSKAVDYDGFPIDTGTIVANGHMNEQGSIPMIIAANNMYHSWDETYQLGEIAIEEANKLERRVAVVGVGGLSGTIFREDIDISQDGIASASDDEWNKRMLKLLEIGDVAGARDLCPEYAEKARVDMGFKHFAWIMGVLGGKFHSARIHAYGAVYGSGAAVVEFKV